MRAPRLGPIASMLALLLAAAPAAARQPAAGITTDLVRAVEQVESKVMGLAEAMPAASWEWRPGEGVRSTREVLQHLAADNWLLPAVAGHAPPASVGIRADDFDTVLAYQDRNAPRDEVIDHLRRSFAHVKDAIAATPADGLDRSVDLFGSETTTRALWLLTTTHIHEHLGQLIAYARSNDVVPPWSR